MDSNEGMLKFIHIEERFTMPHNTIILSMVELYCCRVTGHHHMDKCQLFLHNARYLGLLCSRSPFD